MLLCGAALVASQVALAQESNIESDEEASAPAVTPLKVLFRSGTGCSAPNSVRAALVGTTSDGLPNRLRLIFSDYEATEGLKNCAVRLVLDVPAGWQFGIERARFFGNAELASGVIAKLVSVYSINVVKHATLQTTVAGPKDGPYSQGDSLADEDVVWSTCGATSAFLGFNTNLNIAGTSSPPSSASSTKQVYWLHWRRCM
jgi:hypothetical protein